MTTTESFSNYNYLEKKTTSELLKIINNESVFNSLVELELADKKHNVVFKDVQNDLILSCTYVTYMMYSRFFYKKNLCALQTHSFWLFAVATSFV